MKLSTKTNRFPHTFSKARALECNYSVYVTRPCPASSGWTIDNIDYVTGIGNCIKPEGTMRVVFSTSYLLPVNVRPDVVIRFLSGLGRPPELVAMANST